jgi:hypothetical protein
MRPLDLFYAGTVEPNHRVLLHFQVIFLNVLIPQSDIAVVTPGIYHKADGTHLLQAIDIATRLTLAEPQRAIYDVAEGVFNFRYDLTLFWNQAKALNFGESVSRRRDEDKQYPEDAPPTPHETVLRFENRLSKHIFVRRYMRVCQSCRPSVIYCVVCDFLVYLSRRCYMKIFELEIMRFILT